MEHHSTLAWVSLEALLESQARPAKQCLPETQAPRQPTQGKEGEVDGSSYETESFRRIFSTKRAGWPQMAFRGREEVE